MLRKRIRNFFQKIGNRIAIWKESRISKDQLIEELVIRRDETVERAKAIVNKKIAFHSVPNMVEWIIVPLIYGKYQKYIEVSPELERDSISTIYKVMNAQQSTEEESENED